MEDVVKALERLREAERLRILGLLYVVWIPFVASAGYLMLFISGPWYVIPALALLGLIPYAWLARKLSIEEDRDRKGFVLGILMAFVMEYALSFVSFTLATAGAIAGWLIAVSYYVKKNKIPTWYLDAIAGLAIIALTALASGLSPMKQWMALILSIVIVYSAVAAIRATFGVYEVLPFVREGGKR